MKLRTRFSILTSFLVILIILVFNVFYYFYEKNVLNKDIKAREQALAENFFTVCQDAVIRNDDILILNYIKGIKRTQPGIHFAYLVEPSGLILSLYDSSLFKVPDKALFQTVPRDLSPIITTWADDKGNTIMEISKLLIARNAVMGLSVIGFSKTYYEKIFLQNARQLQNRVLGISLLMIAFGIAASWLLSRTMVNPINTMIGAVQEVGSGNLDQKLNIQDSSELGDLARAFNRMATNLQELDDMKKHFIASVSHELRSPLNAIEGHVDFLIEELYTGFDRDKVIDILHTIKKNSTRLSGFINNILDLSKMEAGKLDLDVEALHLANFAEEAMELFAPLLKEKGITMINKIQYRKNLRVFVDRSRVRQIFNNLISNAIKYTSKDGTITIEAQSSDNMVEVAVRDTGIGIPEDKLQRIFDKFMQIRPHREDVGNVKGTGLGLTIVKGLVEAHGGAIRVESVPGQGSSFIFTIPAAKA